MRNIDVKVFRPDDYEVSTDPWITKIDEYEFYNNSDDVELHTKFLNTDGEMITFISRYVSHKPCGHLLYMPFERMFNNGFIIAKKENGKIFSVTAYDKHFKAIALCMDPSFVPETIVRNEDFNNFIEKYTLTKRTGEPFRFSHGDLLRKKAEQEKLAQEKMIQDYNNQIQQEEYAR